ncbi:hypothetical protein, partial [Pseudomonas viridiflava]|uniref:hypothetical protein n=1 Tax=Pseudomonas viridiflava TaxID=33069 RepID=UPI0019D1AF58
VQRSDSNQASAPVLDILSTQKTDNRAPSSFANREAAGGILPVLLGNCMSMQWLAGTQPQRFGMSLKKTVPCFSISQS